MSRTKRKRFFDKPSFVPDAGTEMTLTEDGRRQVVVVLDAVCDPEDGSQMAKVFLLDGREKWVMYRSLSPVTARNLV